MKIIMVRGLPASGKSTWAKQKMSELDMLRWNNDEFSYMATGIQGPASFHTMSGWLLRVARRDFYTACYAAGQSFIVDNTNLNPYTVEEVVESTGVYPEIVDFKTPVDECIRRDANREHSVGEDVILGMVDRYWRLYDWLRNV